jgi:hypothetical protein
LTKRAKPEGICMAEGCSRPCFGKKWTLCRPCAVAHSRGLEVFTAPCTDYVRETVWHLMPSCATCGFDSADHPGTGTRHGLVVIAA